MHPYPGDQVLQDAVYNATEGLWACCGVNADGLVHCNDPLKEFFAAPAPASMSSTFSVGDLITAAASSSTSTSSASAVQMSSSATITEASKITAATTTESSQTTAIPQSTTSSSQAESSSTSVAAQTHKGLSTGTAAGIGVGCAIAGFTILGTILFLLNRSYRKKASNQNLILGDHRSIQSSIVRDQRSSAASSTYPSYRPTEMSVPSVYGGETIRQSKPEELGGGEYASEMGGSEQWSARERVVELP